MCVADAQVKMQSSINSGFESQPSWWTLCRSCTHMLRKQNYRLALLLVLGHSVYQFTSLETNAIRNWIFRALEVLNESLNFSSFCGGPIFFYWATRNVCTPKYMGIKFRFLITANELFIFDIWSPHLIFDFHISIFDQIFSGVLYACCMAIVFRFSLSHHGSPLFFVSLDSQSIVCGVRVCFYVVNLLFWWSISSRSFLR